MGFFSNLTAVAPQLGPLAWIFFLGQIVGVAAGAYLYFVHTERNPARQTFMRQLGIALLILGGVGMLQGILRQLNVPTLNQHLWFWLQTLIELGVAGYVTYYVRNVLPKLEQSAAPRPGKPGAARVARPADGTRAASLPPAPPRPVPTTTRREARRDRKRKTR